MNRLSANAIPGTVDGVRIGFTYLSKLGLKYRFQEQATRIRVTFILPLKAQVC